MNLTVISVSTEWPVREEEGTFQAIWWQFLRQLQQQLCPTGKNRIQAYRVKKYIDQGKPQRHS